MLSDVLGKIVSYDRKAMQDGSMWWWILPFPPPPPGRAGTACRERRARQSLKTATPRYTNRFRAVLKMWRNARPTFGKTPGP